MSKSGIKYSTERSMKLEHLQNNAMLLIQRQTEGMIGKDEIQFGLPSTFINKDNNETVTINGPSIQLEQIPELVKMLQSVYEKYSEIKSERIPTFADLLDQTDESKN